MENTIVALATPAGNSGVSVVRLSGEKSKDILQLLIKEKLDFEPRKMYYKRLYIDSIVDEGLVVYFKAPHSFTGEDVAEIQLHGGYFLCQKLIEWCLNNGAKMATKGEFSKRAFINGKMSIDKAEGIMDLISAESDAQLNSGSMLAMGKLTAKVNNIQDELTDVLASIEAKLDYPEYEYTEQESADEKKTLSKVVDELNEMLVDVDTGKYIKNGIKIALVGAPNVGKSSLLNALTKTEKAIVTEIAGTTRDIVEAEYEYKGVIFRLFDTAGIHESNDKVERIGIERAKRAIEEADLVLKIGDDENRCEVQTTKPFVEVVNKLDKLEEKDKKSNKTLKNIKNCGKMDKKENKIQKNPKDDDVVYVSALNNINIDELKELIFKKVIQKDIDPNKLYLTNTRHIECVKETKQILTGCLNLFGNISLDIISSQIKLAWHKLGEITGLTSDEKIIDRIFSKFCLGK